MGAIYYIRENIYCNSSDQPDTKTNPNYTLGLLSVFTLVNCGSEHMCLLVIYFRNKESFFEHYKVIILVGAWLNPKKLEGLNNRFDHAPTESITS